MAGLAPAVLYNGLMSKASNPVSARMSQPWFMQGREHRRDGVAVDGDDAWALFCASADGDLDKARRLVDGDPNLVHAQIWYAKPIDVAMREGHVEIVKAIRRGLTDTAPTSQRQPTKK